MQVRSEQSLSGERGTDASLNIAVWLQAQHFIQLKLSERRMAERGKRKKPSWLSNPQEMYRHNDVSHYSSQAKTS